jgi:hypothetical protein
MFASIGLTAAGILPAVRESDYYPDARAGSGAASLPPRPVFYSARPIDSQPPPFPVLARLSLPLGGREGGYSSVVTHYFSIDTFRDGWSCRMGVSTIIPEENNKGFALRFRTAPFSGLRKM